jgi:hypothetical protein
MDLTSLPLSPWNPTDRHITETRISLAKAADLLRMECRYVRAEKLYYEAARYAEGGAAAHLCRAARLCRQLHTDRQIAKERAKARKEAR